MDNVQGVPAALEGGHCGNQQTTVLCDGEGPTTECTATVIASDTTHIQRPTDSKPVLPFELFETILKSAAREDEETAKALCLVSHTARAIIQPMLFRTLIIREQRNNVFELYRFLRTHPHIAKHVRELWMDKRNTSGGAGIVLSCVEVERLAITAECYQAFLALADLKSKMRVTKPMTMTTTATTGQDEKGVRGSILMSSPKELFLLPDRVNWSLLHFRVGNLGYTTCSPFTPSLTRLCLSWASQLQDLLKERYICTSLSDVLTHLAGPVSGIPLRRTVEDVLNTFHSLEMFVIIPQFGDDRWLEHPQRETRESRISWANARTGRHGRVHLLDADDQADEAYFLELWKGGDRFGIWNCAATHLYCH